MTFFFLVVRFVDNESLFQGTSSSTCMKRKQDLASKKMSIATSIPVLIYYSQTKQNLELSWLKSIFVILSIQTQIEIQKALKDDPTVYEYDAVYDEMEEKKKAVNVKVPEKDRKVCVQLL